jgi:hypothetical protein
LQIENEKQISFTYPVQHFTIYTLKNLIFCVSLRFDFFL